MARDPTRFSRVSVGFVDSVQSLVDVDAGDTGATFSVTGPAAFDDTVTITGALTQTGAITGASSVAIGGGTAIELVQSSIISVGGTAVTGHDSVVSNYALSGVTGGDVVLITPDTSLWSGAYHDIGISAFGVSADLAAITMRNSAVTDITPDAMNMRATVIRF